MLLEGTSLPAGNMHSIRHKLRDIVYSNVPWLTGCKGQDRTALFGEMLLVALSLHRCQCSPTKKLTVWKIFKWSQMEKTHLWPHESLLVVNGCFNNTITNCLQVWSEWEVEIFVNFSQIYTLATMYSASSALSNWSFSAISAREILERGNKISISPSLPSSLPPLSLSLPSNLSYLE